MHCSIPLGQHSGSSRRVNLCRAVGSSPFKIPARSYRLQSEAPSYPRSSPVLVQSAAVPSKRLEWLPESFPLAPSQNLPAVFRRSQDRHDIVISLAPATTPDLLLQPSLRPLLRVYESGLQHSSGPPSDWSSSSWIQFASLEASSTDQKRQPSKRGGLSASVVSRFIVRGLSR